MQGVTVTDNSAPQIRRLETPDAALYRDIRLEALQRNPEAFGSTFEFENAAAPLDAARVLAEMRRGGELKPSS